MDIRVLNEGSPPYFCGIFFLIPNSRFLILTSPQGRSSQIIKMNIVDIGAIPLSATLAVLIGRSQNYSFSAKYAALVKIVMDVRRLPQLNSIGSLR